MDVHADDVRVGLDTGAAAPPRVLSIGAEWQTETPGGANRYTYELSKAWARQEVEQRWVVVGDRPESPDPSCLVKAAAPTSLWLPQRLNAVRRVVRESIGRCDVVASHFALYAAAAGGVLHRRPHVVHFHGPWADESRAEGASSAAVAAKRWIERRAYRSADRFVTLSQAFARVLEERYRADPARIHVVPGGVDIERFSLRGTREDARRRLGWPTDRPIVLCVRRLVRRVGLEPLIDAMAALRATCPEVLLMVAGKGPLAEELASRVEQLGLTGSVRLLGFVEEQDLPMTYRAADLSVVPSQSLEGFGLIIPESLAAGTPVLVTPVGGMPEVVGGLDSGLIFSDPTPGAISSGLADALTGAVTLPTDQACNAYARERFAWPVVARQVLGVYREAIDAHG